MSQPWKVKPSGCPSAGPALLLPSWQSAFGGVDVNSVGKSAITRKKSASTTENQNSGRRRRSAHASRHRLRGFSAMRTASTEMVSVSTGATK